MNLYEISKLFTNKKRAQMSSFDLRFNSIEMFNTLQTLPLVRLKM